MLHARTFRFRTKALHSYREVKEISEKDALTGLRNDFLLKKGLSFYRKTIRVSLKLH